MTTSKVSVDLKARTFSVEVPDEKLDGILDRLASMFLVGPQEIEEGAHSDAGRDDSPGDLAKAKVAENGKPKRRSKGGGGKTKTWSVIDLGLSEVQRNELRDFYAQKMPKGQGEEVAVLTVKLSEFLSKKAFTGDEVHSALKIVERPTPKNMTAVFGNLKRDAIGDYKGLDFLVNHLTEDFVKFKLPKPALKGK